LIAAATLLLCISGQFNSGPVPDLKTGKCLAVSELGKEIGLELEVPGTLDSQIVFIKSGSAAKEETLTKLAESLNGSAKQENGVWKITRSQAAITEEAKREHTLKSQAIKKALDLELAAHSDDPEKWAKDLVSRYGQGWFDQSLTATAAFLRDLLKTIGPEELAKGQLVTGRVWSNQPTIAERSFPSGFNSAFQTYTSKNQQLGRLLEKRGDVKWDSWTKDGPVGQAIYPKPVSVVHLITSGWTDRLSANLWLFGEDGKQLDFATVTLRLTHDKSAVFRGGKTEFDISEDIKSLFFKKEESPQLVSKEVGEERKKRFSKEPLDVIAGALLAQAAEIHGLKVVSPMPDDLHRVIVANPPKTTEDLFALFATAGVVFTEKDGWLIGRLSARPAQLGRLNLDRPQLKLWLERSSRLGLEWVREECRLAYVSGDGYFGNTLDDWLRMEVISPIHGHYILWPNVDVHMRMLLGSLSDQEWEATLAGGAISVAPGTARGNWILSRSIGTLILRRVDDMALPDLMKAGTVSLANGLPVGSSLRLKIGQIKAVRGGRWPNSILPLANVPSNMAYLVNEVNDSELSTAISGPHTIGFTGDLSLELRYGSSLNIIESIKLEGFTQLKEGIWFTDWPKEWKDEVTKGVKAIKDRSDQTGTARPPATFWLK
jgi:hypothetical protein